MGLFDRFDDFVSGVRRKFGQSAKDVGTVASTPVGMIFDSLKFAVSDDSFRESIDAAGDRAAKGGAALSDLLIGEGSISGWTISRTGQALNWTYENALENPIESVIYKEFMPPSADPVSWAQAWDLSRDRSIGETSMQWLNASKQHIASQFGDGAAETVFGSPTLGRAGDPADPNSVATKPSNAWKGIDYTDPKAVEKYRDYNPNAGFSADAITFATQWYADPFVIATKPLKGLRDLRAIDPTYRAGSEAAKNASAASKLYNRVLPERTGKWENNLEQLFGKVKHEPTGELDDDGVEAFTATMDKLGWIDEHTDAEIYVGLGLDKFPAASGANLATLLGRTRDIKDAAQRVNARRAIYGAAHGDVNAVRELQGMADSGPEMARILSNAFTARSNGSVVAALRDAPVAGEIAAGKVVRTQDDPAIIADAVREVTDQAGYEGWLFASLRDRSLRVTASGERAVARLRGQGLGRDGTLHTGLTSLDQTVNAALGGFRNPASKVEEALNESGALRNAEDVRPQGLAGGDVVTAPQSTRIAGFNQMPTTVLHGGWRLAKIAAIPVRPSTYTKIADSIRGLSTPSGALVIEDAYAPQVFKVMQERMRTTGMKPDFIGHHLDQIVHASNPTQRSLAIKRAEAGMIGVVAQRHGVDTETVKELSQHLSRSQDEMVAAINGQRYSAHQRQLESGATVPGDVIAPGNDGVVYFLDDDGVVAFGLGKGTEATPVLSTQTPNFLPLHDVRHAEKWLRRDRLLAPTSRVKRTIESNDGLIGQTESLGIHRRTATVKNASEVINHTLGGINGWWKRSVLGLRPVSYALRNTSEEMMRTAAAGHIAVWMDEAARQGAFSARQMVRDGLLNDRQWETAAALHARRSLRIEELDTLRAVHADPEVQRQVEAAQELLDSLDDPLEREFLQSLVVESGTREAELARLESEIASLGSQIDGLSDAAKTQSIDGVASEIEFPAAFFGQSGVRNSDFLYGHTQLDYETTGAADRLYGHMRGVDPGGIISVGHAAVAEDPLVVKRHAAAWRWIVNKQIRQAPEAMVAVKVLADGGSHDEALGAVAQFLRSPKSRKWRDMNPQRSGDLDAYAQDIAEMVTHYVPTRNMADALRHGEVEMDDLLRDFENVTGRPDVHVAGVDALVGSRARVAELLAGRWLQYLDKMGPQRFTRHPMYSVFYADEQQRLAHKFAELREAEEGPGALLSVEDVNVISKRAADHAGTQIKRMFYDASVRSTAADRLRFIYPFFAAHQDSMRFWGQTIGQDPTVLRRLQQLFQLPAQVGLVVDYEGNPVKPGEFPSSDHYVLMQVPANWGGPNPKDPEAKQPHFKLPLASFNLITQNGSILNPGAGPMAAIPAGWIQQSVGASNEDVSKAMTWFNPFGAPKSDESTMGVLDPAMPTPVKRFREAADAYKLWLVGDEERLYTTQLYSQRLTEAQVRFQKDHGRPPNKQEAKKLVNDVAEKVKHVTLLRFFMSTTAPVQAQPQTALQGYVSEFRRLQDKQNAEGLGPLWATDRFLETYGDDYIALTKSSSQYRANLDPTHATVAELKAHEKLIDQTDPAVWQAIVGGAGEGGAFSIDSYRWMQNKVVDRGSGDTLIDRKSPLDRIFDTAVADGWREYNKFMNQLRSTATEYGFDSVEQSDQLSALRRAAIKELGEENPSWFEAFNTRSADYESKVLPSLQRVANDKSLVNDPARSDIRMIGQYLEVREAVTQFLKLRAEAGFSGNIEAKENEFVATAYATVLAKMAQDNTLFSDYAFTGLIEKDPLYKAELLGSEPAA